MKRLFQAAFLFGFSISAFAADQGQIPDVQTIVNKANIVAYYQGEDGKATVKMKVTSKQGQERQHEFNILRKDVADGGDQKYFVYFQRPADVRRMTYMVLKHADPGKDDDRWLYLPALSLVKRIAAGDKRTSFVGSDFETNDQFFIVRNVPKQPDSVEFNYFNVSIDRMTYVPMKMEFYDKDDKLYRVIESKKVEKIQDFYTVVQSVVSNLKTGSKTEMEFSNVEYNIGLKDDIFSERYMQRPPREAMR